MHSLYHIRPGGSKASVGYHKTFFLKGFDVLRLSGTKGRWAVVGLLLLMTAAPAWAETDQDKPCAPVEENKIKVEGYINKEFYRERRKAIAEFTEIGHTTARIRPFPMGKTARVVAVGRCVPAYIARHVLTKALKYTDGIESLVNQAFLHSHWIGIGTTTFDEPSQQTVTPKQVEQLLNPDLSDAEFHALYRKFSIQDDTVPYFGRTPENVKKVD